VIHRLPEKVVSFFGVYPVHARVVLLTGCDTSIVLYPGSQEMEHHDSNTGLLEIDSQRITDGVNRQQVGRCDLNFSAGGM